MVVQATSTSSDIPTVTKFYLVPSGNTEDDPKVLPTQIFSSLSPEGRKQAVKVAQYLSPIPFDIMYSSDAKNAQETATIINQGRPSQILFTRSLREFQYGKLAGRPNSEYFEIINKMIGSKRYDTIEKRYNFRVAEGSETVNEVFERMMAFLWHVHSNSEYKNILFVSHSRLISVFVASLFKRDIDAVTVPNNGFAVISKRSDNDDFRYWGGKNMHVFLKMRQEGLFETCYLTSDIDEGWGHFFFNTMEDDDKMARKQLFTFLANAHFTQTDDEVTRSHFLSLYQSVLTPNMKEKAKTMKESCLKKLHEYAVDIVRDVNHIDGEGFAEGVKGITFPGSPWINHILMCLYELGDTTMLSSYVYYLETFFGSMGGVQPFVEAWVQKIYNDFTSRKPISFPMMAKLISDRHIGKVSISGFFPFSDIHFSFDILKKLAALQIKEAEDGLAIAYSTNAIGEGNNKVELHLPLEEAYKGLWILAEQGNEKAQDALASMYYSNKPYNANCYFNEEQRRNGISGLLQIEKKHNHFITDLFWTNTFGDLNYHFTQKERIDALYERSKAGDEAALHHLMTMYETNQLGPDGTVSTPGISLGLSSGERLAKMIELMEIADQNGKLHCVANFFTKFVKDNSIGNGQQQFSLEWSLDKRLKWLEVAALEHRSASAAEILACAYESNKLGTYEYLHFSNGERLQKLYELALIGNQKAVILAVQHYIASKAHDKLMEIVLNGKNYHYGHYMMTHLEKTQKDALKILLLSMEMLNANLYRT